MLCRALLVAAAVTYLICVLVLSGMQKEDLDVNLLRKLQRHNVNADDINSDKVRQECKLNSSAELSILNTRRNNDYKSSVIQNVTTTANTEVDNSSDVVIHNYNVTTQATVTKYVLKDRFNETIDKSAYKVGATKEHNIRTRSSVNNVANSNSTQSSKQFSEAMTFFGEKKNLDNVMNMLQTFLVAKLVENNNTNILKGLTTNTPLTTIKIPLTKPIEITTENINKDSDLIKVLATFVFNKPVPVEPQYNHNTDKNPVISEILDNVVAKSAKTDRPDDYSNDDPTTTELFSDHDYLSYKRYTAEITSSGEEDYKPSVSSSFNAMMNKFRTKYKINPKHKTEYQNNESVLASSQTDNFYVPYLKKALNLNSDLHRQLDDFEYSKLVDVIKPEKHFINIKNGAEKSLHPNVIKEIADTVRDLVLRDLRKEMLPSYATATSSVTTTEEITTAITQKHEKNHIQQATYAIQKFVELLEQLKSVKKFIVSPVEYNLSKEGDKNSEFRVEAKGEETNFKQNMPKSTPATVKLNNYNKIHSYMPNMATVDGYKMPGHNVPMQYSPSYPIVSYFDDMPNKMVPPLISNPYGVQQPGDRAIINVPQASSYNNKPNTINIITPVNHTPVININQMRPAPIMMQTSKEIPPLGIPMSRHFTLNRNIVLPTQPPFMATLNETERHRWEYIMKYGRNPDTRGDITDRKDKLSQYTNFKTTPNKQESDKKADSSILNFSTSNKRQKLPDYTKFSLPTLNIRERDKTIDPTVLTLSLLKTRDRMNDHKMFSPLALNKQERERLIDFKNSNLPSLNGREPDRISGSKTFSSLDTEERERMMDFKNVKSPTINTKDQDKEMIMNKLDLNDKQQQACDEALLSDIKANLLYRDRYKIDDVYPGLFIRQPLNPRTVETLPKQDYYERPHFYNSRFLEASANYHNMDPNSKHYYKNFIKEGPSREYSEMSKQRDPLYIPRKDPMPKQIHDIKGFHEKLERGDYYERQRDPVNGWYENPNVPRQYDVNTNKYDKADYDKADYSKSGIESRQQLPLTGGTRVSKFDDTHFKNFLKTQQKVNDMLERILATKTKPEFERSVETT